MQNHLHVFSDSGNTRLFEPIGSHLYLNYTSFSQYDHKFWEDYYKQFPQNVIVISYDFSLQYLHDKAYYDEPGFFIQPVKEIYNPDITSFTLPCITKLYMGLSKKNYLNLIDPLLQEIRRGVFYFINYTFPVHATLQNYSVLTTQLSRYLGDHGTILYLPDTTLFSFSPELFLQINNNIILTKPIKGTQVNTLHLKHLLNNTKEHAEQIMVVDLLRNDLGRICQYGTVEVAEFKKIKQHHNLHQMYSVITGVCNSFSLPVDLLKLLPAGSITGMPKYEICSYLKLHEIQRRSFYTGIAGFYDTQNQMGFMNLLIRMLEVHDDIATMGVGSGITINSIPSHEYQEVCDKAHSIKQNLKTLSI